MRTAEHCLYIMVEETTYAKGKYIANLIIGALTHEEAGKLYLIASLEIERTNVLSANSFAPLVSVDLERSFSFHKLILSDRRY